MLTQLVDASFSVLGRRFFFGAFLPMAIFLLVVYTLIFGGSAAETFILGFAQQDLAQATFEVVAIAALTFVLAYLMHGLRQLMRAFYDGVWPWPLSLLVTPFRFLENRALRQREEALQEALQVKDDVLWWYRDYSDMYIRRKAPPSPGPAELAKLKALVDEVLAKLPDDAPPVAKILKLFKELRTLHRHRGGYPGPVQTSLEAMVQDLRSKLPQPRADAAAAPTHVITAERAAGVFEALRSRSQTGWLDAYVDRYSAFPRDERWLRPTRFGNISMVNQEYPLLRYGIALGELWPRLSEVLSSAASERIDEAQTYVDFTLALTTLAAAAGAVSAYALLPDAATAWSGDWAAWRSSPWLAWAITSVLLFAASFVFYRLAIGASLVLNRQMQGATDLFRLKVLEQMEIAKPRTPGEEAEIWRELSAHIVQATRPTRWRWFVPR
jgi:hypothetical protein